MAQNKKLWFKARRYGWGWTPVSWQGWLCLALLIIYMALVALWLVKASPARSTSNDGLLKGTIGFLLISAGIFVFVGIGYGKGQKPSWRWGDKKDKDKTDE